MDLSGRFTDFSASGHAYLLVGYNYDANAILFEPLKKYQVKTIADRQEKINQKLERSGVQPHTYVLDNEVSKKLEKAFEKDTFN